MQQMFRVRSTSGYFHVSYIGCFNVGCFTAWYGIGRATYMSTWGAL